MAGSANAAAKSEMIDLTNLSPDQLMQIKQEFEQVSVCQSHVGVAQQRERMRETGGRCNAAAVAHVNNNCIYVQEMTNIQDSLSTLHSCKAKYAGSKDALEAFQPDWENRQILVPLTSSMYVPGRIKDLNNFVIDIGTGYYIEKVTTNCSCNSYGMLMSFVSGSARLQGLLQATRRVCSGTD